ncbi:MAG: Asp-tRNA(Asn)/Glu-tRNA(Gln) amidotransferase subunit GatC [Gammaproteobacteria bacterium]|nr:Asp-tRNA(Asn)/Glu-tRNA(Gln) amidotransferase subunit GatC [Gammaproteobacteria bacterium]
MPVSLEEILKISHLARLHVDPEEAGQYAADLSSILAWVQQMNKVDTRGVDPMAHPLDACQRLREDKVTESDQREKFQAIAPRTENGLYLVPKVIE